MVWLHKALMEQFWFLLIKWKQASSTISTYTTRKRETHEPGGKQWGLELPEPLGRQERSRVKRGPWRKRRETEHWGKKEQDWKSCLYSWLFIPGPYRHLPQLHTPSLAGDSCHHHQTCHSLCASHCGLSYLILNDTLEGINLIPILQIRTLKFSELYHSLQITLLISSRAQVCLKSTWRLWKTMPNGHKIATSSVKAHSYSTLQHWLCHPNFPRVTEDILTYWSKDKAQHKANTLLVWGARVLGDWFCVCCWTEQP